MQMYSVEENVFKIEAIASLQRRDGKFFTEALLAYLFTMIKIFSRFLFIGLVCTAAACNMATPEEYFDQAVLNTNMLSGFANEGFYRELEQPSVKLNETTGKTEPMKRSELVADKIAWAEQSLKKIKALHPTDETKDMLQTSTALFEYVLPAYKNDYTQLSKLYDDNAPKSQIDAKAEAIYNKYYAGFEEQYKKLISLGKPYAAAHNIKVEWGGL